MNHSIIPGLSAQEAAHSRLLLGSLVSRGGLTSSATIRTVTAASIGADGLLDETPTSDTVSGTFGPLTQSEVSANPFYQLSDYSLLVELADLTAGHVPTITSTATIGSVTYKVLGVVCDALKATYRLILRKTN
jgi:hypothetical protein